MKQKLWHGATMLLAGLAPYIALVNTSASPLATESGQHQTDQLLEAREALQKSAAKANIELKLADEMPLEQLIYEWDALKGNNVYIIHNRWQDIFAIDVYENLLVPFNMPSTYEHGRGIDPSLFVWTHTGYGLHGEIDQVDVVNFHSSIDICVSSNRIDIEGTITNREDFDWGAYGGALLCIRSRLNPDFHDFQGERIYLHDERDNTEHSVYDLIGRDSKFFSFWLNRPDPHTTDYPYLSPWISKENLSSNKRITAGGNHVSTLHGNREEQLSCIHANLRLAHLGPGETLQFHRYITFTDLPAAASSWELYR